MQFFLYINYPSWLHPQIFPTAGGVLQLLRWYGLMYVVAFATAFCILKNELRTGELDTVCLAGKGPSATAGKSGGDSVLRPTEDDLFGVMTYGIICLIIGARVFATLVYDTSGVYRRAPWLMFWPFDSQTGQFTGLAGMSYHGGFIGGWIGVLLWCAVHKKNALLWMDALSAAIPAGYTFGRLGNFLNGELYGRITAMPWGMVFPHAEKFSLKFDWVRAFAAKCGMEVAGQGMINLPRHPSQLYEAATEGIGLFLLLVLVRRHKRRSASVPRAGDAVSRGNNAGRKDTTEPWHGEVSGVYVLGYGTVRFILEYFREPDADIGYRIARDATAPIYTNTSLLNFSTGQVLCFGMVIIGAAILVCSSLIRKKANHKEGKSIV